MKKMTIRDAMREVGLSNAYQIGRHGPTFAYQYKSNEFVYIIPHNNCDYGLKVTHGEYRDEYKDSNLDELKESRMISPFSRWKSSIEMLLVNEDDALTQILSLSKNDIQEVINNSDSTTNYVRSRMTKYKSATARYKNLYVPMGVLIHYAYKARNHHSQDWILMENNEMFRPERKPLLVKGSTTYSAWRWLERIIKGKHIFTYSKDLFMVTPFKSMESLHRKMKG